MQFLGIFQAMVPLFYWALTGISNAYELFVNNKLFDFEKIFKSANPKAGTKSSNKFPRLRSDPYNLRKL